MPAQTDLPPPHTPKDEIASAPARLPTETVDPHLASQHRPLTEEERLEEALQETMDGSDAPSITRPGDHGEPVPSSGFIEEEAAAGQH